MTFGHPRLIAVSTILACVALISVSGCSAVSTSDVSPSPAAPASAAPLAATLTLSASEVPVDASVTASISISNVSDTAVSFPYSEPITVVVKNDARVFAFTPPGGLTPSGSETIGPGQSSSSAIRFRVPVAGDYAVTVTQNSVPVSSTVTSLVVK